MAALHSYRVLDTPPDEALDRIADQAAALFEAPMALVSLVDETRQWFKAKTGVDACSTPRELAFCAHALALPPHEVMVVEDATTDPRFATNSLVTGPPHVRFYVGALLTDRAGYNLGTLCVIDTMARPHPSDRQLGHLRTLARIVVDELELMRAQRQASEQRRLLLMAESMSGVGHWRLDLKSRRSVWSSEVYRIYGQDPALYDPKFANTLQLIHEDDRVLVQETLAKAIAEGGGFEIPMRVRRPDGALREIMSKGACEIDESGQVSAVFGVLQDVTDRNATLRHVERSRAGYKLLADNMADVVTRIRMDGSSDYISPAIESLLGYTPAEMAGLPAQAFVFEPDQPLLLRTFTDLAAGMDDATVQLRAAHKLGYPIWVEARFRMIRDADGRPHEMVAVIRDVSVRKHLENELHLAREAAEAASAVKSEFLANMSHELRTPLTSIVGFTGLAAAHPGVPRQALDYILRVENASQALLCTVNDILDFSKLEAGQVPIEPRPTDIAKLAQATLDLFTPQAGARDLQLKLDIDTPPGVLLMVDPDRIRQLLLNLVGNAVKFTTEGAVTLEVYYHAGEQRLGIAVDDSGPGIAPDKLGRLFQRFSQVDGSLTRQHGGTGLGLAICKGLVEAMGGRIGAESTLGRGSRFWLVLPAPQAEPEILSGGVAKTENAAFSGISVLIADDHPANRELARIFLAGAGAEVSEVSDGRAAVELADHQPFDAILMDVRMPRLDGFGALRAIRSGDGPNQFTLILAYTADASPEEAYRLKAAGFDAVVSKPVVPAALMAAVAEAAEVNRRQRQQSVAAKR